MSDSSPPRRWPAECLGPPACGILGRLTMRSNLRWAAGGGQFGWSGALNPAGGQYVGTRFSMAPGGSFFGGTPMYTCTSSMSSTRRAQHRLPFLFFLVFTHTGWIVMGFPSALAPLDGLPVFDSVAHEVRVCLVHALFHLIGIARDLHTWLTARRRRLSTS